MAKYYRQRRIIDSDDDETNAWGCVADRKTLCMESNRIEEMDKEIFIKNFSAEDRIIIEAYQSGSKQK